MRRIDGRKHCVERPNGQDRAPGGSVMADILDGDSVNSGRQATAQAPVQQSRDVNEHSWQIERATESGGKSVVWHREAGLCSPAGCRRWNAIIDIFCQAMKTMRSISRGYRIFAMLGVIAQVGCQYLPTVGPSLSDIEKQVGPLRISEAGKPRLAGIQIVDVDDAVARQLLALRSQQLFSETLGNVNPDVQSIGAGDVIEVSLWEAPPATLFGSGQSLDPRAGIATARVVTFPEQTVNQDGYINMPFAGPVMATGQTMRQIEAQIVDRLKSKANQPQVLVRLIRNMTLNATVVGDVVNSTRMPLTPRGERLLDALAAAGGVRQPVNRMTIQVTRGSQVHALPLDVIIRDPKQNVPLAPGDVVTALFQPLSFTALGATGKNEEINFEAQGITLAQALARSGGLVDTRSDAQGVFIFRFEPKEAMKWPKEPVLATPDGKVPVIYRIDLRDPSSFFVAQSFMVNNKDLLYVSNAPIAELQKFLNVVFSVAYPVLTAISVTKK